MKLRVALADDELMARKRLSRLVVAMPDVELVAVCASADELLKALPVDVVLLDVRMPGLSGIDVAALLGEPRPAVIYVTAHRDHAVDAFDIGAVDYVLKPVDASRLRQAIDRVRKTPQDKLAVHTGQGVVLVDIGQISLVSFDGTLTTIHRVDGASLMTDQSLSALSARLPELMRVHRRYLLSLTHTERLSPTPSGAYVALTVDGHEVPVSRQAARRLRKTLQI